MEETEPQSRYYYRQISLWIKLLFTLNYFCDTWLLYWSNYKRYLKIENGSIMQCVFAFYFFVPGDMQYDYFWAFAEWLQNGCSFFYCGQCLDTCIVSELNIFDITGPVMIIIGIICTMDPQWYEIFSVELTLAAVFQIIVIAAYQKYFTEETGYRKLLWRTNLISRIHKLQQKVTPDEDQDMQVLLP